MRPEEYGALVHANLTKSTPAPQAAGALHKDVLNSAVLPIIHQAYGSFLLPQAFPEGSPTHPCYPTGHGTVGGACITVLKFFFDGSQKIRPLLTHAGRDVVVPSTDGLSLNTYTGADRDNLDINGELNKLAYNISFGHGIHAGIHFRSSTLLVDSAGRADCAQHAAGPGQVLQRAVHDQHHEIRRNDRNHHQRGGSLAASGHNRIMKGSRSRSSTARQS